MRLMWHTECWLDNMADAIDEAEQKAGVCQDVNAYADIAEALRSRVYGRLIDAGIQANWSYQQSVGVGAIVQSADESEMAAFDAAMESERSFVEEQVRLETAACAEATTGGE